MLQHGQTERTHTARPTQRRMRNANRTVRRPCENTKSKNKPYISFMMWFGSPSRFEWAAFERTQLCGERVVFVDKNRKNSFYLECENWNNNNENDGMSLWYYDNRTHSLLLPFQLNASCRFRISEPTTTTKKRKTKTIVKQFSVPNVHRIRWYFVQVDSR